MEESLADFFALPGFERNASAYTIKSYREDLNQALGFFRSNCKLPSSRWANFSRASCALMSPAARRGLREIDHGSPRRRRALLVAVLACGKAS